jgi:hypothetical protein
VEQECYRSIASLESLLSHNPTKLIQNQLTMLRYSYPKHQEKRTLSFSTNLNKTDFFDCKTFIHRFDSDRRLFRIKKLRAATRLPVLLCVPIVCQSRSFSARREGVGRRVRPIRIDLLMDSAFGYCVCNEIVLLSASARVSPGILFGTPARTSLTSEAEGLVVSRKGI